MKSKFGITIRRVSYDSRGNMTVHPEKKLKVKVYPEPEEAPKARKRRKAA